jgi:UDP-N-acetyl-D-mannosaminuronate dehydrogenase
MEFCELLSIRGMTVVGHDPLAFSMQGFHQALSFGITDDLAEALKDAETVIVATPDPAYKNLSGRDLMPDNEVLVLDCWRLVPNLGKDPRVHYVAVGQNRVSIDSFAFEGG